MVAIRKKKSLKIESLESRRLLDSTVVFNELLYNALEVGGLCKHHTTNILIENGALTMTKAEAKALKIATGGRINVIHTGIGGHKKHIAGGLESRSGKWMDKAMIESSCGYIRRKNSLP